ncbi:MAG: hypothetical protein JSS35_10055 [Proteobacteria bacterium]|nr:hypothetical protein [Pseudomonadota bacterium]
MALVIVAGFSTQFATGRSSFGAPLMVHLHAVTFMGWVAIYLTQNLLVGAGHIAAHRKLGWFAAGWVGLMLVMGCAVTAFDIRVAHVPFFFRPLQFLALDPGTLFGFAALTYAAIALRRRTDWHRRLHFSGMTLLMGPAFGRLLPMPLLQPWAFEANFAVCLVFPLAGMFVDWRRDGRVHPAWFRGLAVILAVFVAVEAVTYSPLGLALYRTVAAGSKGASVEPLAFGHPPGPPPSSGK